MTCDCAWQRAASPVPALATLLVAAWLCAACSGAEDNSHGNAQSNDSTARTMGRPGDTYVYRCSDGLEFTARVEDGTAWLFLPSGTISLPRVTAASGAKYTDGTTTYWNKGEQAMLQQAQQQGVECTNNRKQAIWEDAKLRGADFRATGNEPGWHLEISRDYGIVFVTNYGAERYHFNAVDIASDPTAARTTYHTRQDGHDLSVTLEGKRCLDSMSGDQFETTVVVVFDGETLNGCGRPLH